MQHKNIALVFGIANLLRNHLTTKKSKIMTGLKGTKVYMVDIYLKGNQRKKRSQAKNSVHFSQIETIF